MYALLCLSFQICCVFAEKMLQMGFTLKEIQESLSENRYDEVCATYMLLKRDVNEVSREEVNAMQTKPRCACMCVCVRACVCVCV